jgi:heme/copper-type cytochrome/quinol oxidase subunit 2
MRNILIVTVLFLSTTSLLSAQSMASLHNVNQAKLEVSNAVHFIEQNILLALTAGVLFLGIIFVCYVVKEYANSNQTQKAKHNHFLSLIVLVVGSGLFCSSCGVAQEMHAASSDLTQAHIQHGCPHHQANQEPVAFANIYRTIGYPAQRTSACKFCGQQIVNTRD